MYEKVKNLFDYIIFLLYYYKFSIMPLKSVSQVELENIKFRLALDGLMVLY